MLCLLRTPAQERTVFHSTVLLTLQLATKLQRVNADRGTPIVVKYMSHPVRAGHISLCVSEYIASSSCRLR